MEYIDEDIDDNDVVEQENDAAKRLHTSEGDTPGKPSKKTRRVSCAASSTSSRALFQTPGRSPKVLNTVSFYYIKYICTLSYNIRTFEFCV